MPRARSTGLAATLTNPDTGRVIRPDVLDEPEILPSLNGQPEVRVPVRRSDAWLDLPAATDMTVTRDGVELPVDELADVEQRSDRTILVGEGGSDLETRVTEEFSEEQRHEAAETLINNYSSYTADVDTPDVETLLDELLQDADTTAEWEAENGEPSTSPVWFDGDQYRLHDTCVPMDGTDYTSSNATDSFVNEDFSGSSPDDCFGEAVALTDNGDYAEWEFTIDYEWDASNWDFGLRYAGRIDDPGFLDVEWTIDGGNTFGFAAGTDESVFWVEELFASENGTQPTLSPGTHTMRAEVVDKPGDGILYIDHLAPHDTRLSYNFDDDVTCVDGVNLLDGPGNVGDEFKAEFVDAATAFSISAASVDTTPSSGTTAPQTLQLSPDNGGTWLPDDGTESDTNSIDVTLADPTATVRARIGIGGHSPNGTRDESPRENYASESIDSFELRADITQESLLIDETYDNDLESVLNDIAGEEFVWSYRLDANGDGEIAWTQPGQRTAGQDSSLEADPTVTKNQSVYEKVTINGSNQSISDKRFTASSTFQNLFQDDLVPGSESVYDPDSGTQFTRGEDYEMKYQAGEIRTLSGSGLESGSEYAIDYRHQVQGSHTVDGAGASPRELVETIPGIVSDRSAQQVAFVITEIDPGLESPRYAADVVIPRSKGLIDPLEALSLKTLNLPDAATPLAIREPPQITPEGIALRVGSKRRLESVLGDLSSRVQAVSRRS